jgi:ATP-dependent helicase/nuclease subunit B
VSGETSGAIFGPCDGPRVFGLPPGVDFAAELVAGLDDRLAGSPPETAARVEIWVNTQRARRALVTAFSAGPARLLPRIRVVTELASDPLGPGELPPPASSLGRKLDLARLVGALIRAEPGLAPPSAAFDLADSLGALVDEMLGEGVALSELATLDVGEHAEHWRRSLRFLELIGDYVAAAPSVSGEARLRAAAEARAADWAMNPPEHPVIVAGSTGSRAPTRLFMAAVARLPQGALLLPGFDADLPETVWARLGAAEAGSADHPQAGFRRLADALGFDPGAVAPWRAGPAPAPARNKVVSLALRPAPVTGQWRSEGGALTPTLAEAMAGVTWIEAESPRAEARALALTLRRAAEEGQRAALITPDRALARRVTAELDRWALRPDDSAGRPLALTPPGILLRRLAAAACGPLTPEALAALLKHPLTASGAADRAGHRRLTTRLELEKLRGGWPEVDWGGLSGWASEAEAGAWLDWLRGALAPVEDAGPADLAERVARHRAVAEALAAGPGGDAAALWDKEAGRQCLALMADLAAEAPAYGPISPQDYRALISSLMAQGDVPEEAVVAHPGVAIWGTLEARVQSADLVILAGLTEGVWPRIPPADPWLSRPMRRALGLPAPERVIGLAAHDFQMAMGASRVVISRAIHDAAAPTVPSRWLLRLENLLAGLGAEGKAALAAARARGAETLALAALLDRPEASAPPARRPAPRPPASARPAMLSVTQVETLVRDPYAIYALKVLGLRPLDPLGQAPDALARGSAIHGALEAFLAATEGELPPDARAVFDARIRAALAEAAPWPAVRAIWTARLDRAAEWFLAEERTRRSRGSPAAREIRGRLDLPGLDGPFALTARADRIDRNEAGAYAIYDYKSGGVPSARQAAEFHLQLPLEAAIAEAGGFAPLPPGPTAHLELIGIGARKTLTLQPDVAETLARLRVFIGAYQDARLGYVARLRPSRLAHAGDYDHLSRWGEWSDGDPPEETPWD